MLSESRRSMAGLSLSSAIPSTSATATATGDTLHFEPLGREVQEFQQHFDRWVQQQTERLNQTKQQHIKSTQQEKEQIAVLQKQIHSAEGEEGRVLKVKEIHAEEIAQLQQKVTRFMEQRRIAKDQETEWNRKVYELKCLVDRKCQEKQNRTQQKELDTRMREPELQCFQDRLAMRISSVGSADSDHLKFTWTCVDDQDWDREFSIVISVAEKDYRIVQMQPKLEEMPSLLHQLNKDRDFYQFLKHVRSSFVEQMKREKL